MFPLLLQTIISNQMRPRRLRGDQLRTVGDKRLWTYGLWTYGVSHCDDCICCCRFDVIVGWTATLWGRAVVMCRVVRPSVRPSVCLSHANISGTKRDRRMVTKELSRNLSFPIQKCHQIRDRKCGSAILGVSGSAFRPLWQTWRTRPYQWGIEHRHRSIYHLAEISYDRTKEDSRRKTRVETGTGSRIPPGGVA